jgi:hypothetical protein
MKIYISGAITGDSNYKAKFEKAKKDLETSGYRAVNPAEFELPEGATWEDYMKQDLALLLKCDGIYMLKDWRQSRGARIEQFLAKELKMQVQYELANIINRMTITSYFGLKSCCDCGRTAHYTVNKGGYQFTVCADCLQNYTDVEEEENE